MATAPAPGRIFTCAKVDHIKWGFTVDQIERMIQMREELRPKEEVIALDEYAERVLCMSAVQTRRICSNRRVKIFKLLNKEGKYQNYITATDAERLTKMHFGGRND